MEPMKRYSAFLGSLKRREYVGSTEDSAKNDIDSTAVVQTLNQLATSTRILQYPRTANRHRVPQAGRALSKSLQNLKFLKEKKEKKKKELYLPPEIWLIVLEHASPGSLWATRQLSQFFLKHSTRLIRTQILPQAFIRHCTCVSEPSQPFWGFLHEDDESHVSFVHNAVYRCRAGRLWAYCILCVEHYGDIMEKMGPDEGWVKLMLCMPGEQGGEESRVGRYEYVTTEMWYYEKTGTFGRQLWSDGLEWEKPLLRLLSKLWEIDSEKEKKGPKNVLQEALRKTARVCAMTVATGWNVYKCFRVL